MDALLTNIDSMQDLDYSSCQTNRHVLTQFKALSLKIYELFKTFNIIKNRARFEFLWKSVFLNFLDNTYICNYFWWLSQCLTVSLASTINGVKLWK